MSLFHFIAWYPNLNPLRNLCALEWAISHPKGTTDDFGTYYDGLSAEEKEVSISEYSGIICLTSDDLEMGKALS